MRERLELIVEHNVALYDSTNMKIGINVDLLVRAKDLLKSLLVVDKRGGLFRQGDLVAGLRQCMLEKQQDRPGGHFDMLKAKTLHLPQGMDEIVEVIAYKLRLMLSRVRIS